MTDRITHESEIEQMLSGVSDQVRNRVVAGAVADIDEQLRDLRLRNAELTKRRMAIAERSGYPSGYGID
jgi:hypothetical protein